MPSTSFHLQPEQFQEYVIDRESNANSDEEIFRVEMANNLSGGLGDDDLKFGEVVNEGARYDVIQDFDTEGISVDESEGYWEDMY